MKMLAKWLSEAGETYESASKDTVMTILAAAVSHADEFADGLPGESEDDLRLWAWFIDFEVRKLRQGILPPNVAREVLPSLQQMVEDLDAACEREAERRGVVLEVWSHTRFRQLRANAAH